MTNWNTNQPIIHYLRQWVPHYFPQIVGRGQHKPSGIGGYASTNPSITHQEGRAADIYVHARRPTLKAIGDGLFRIFSGHPYELGVENVVFNVLIWRGEGDPSGPPDLIGRPRPFTRVDHVNHLHVSFTRAGSQLQPAILLVYLEGLARELRGTTDEYMGEESGRRKRNNSDFDTPLGIIPNFYRP